MKILKLLPVMLMMLVSVASCSNDDNQPASYQLQAADGRTITMTASVQQYQDEASFVEMLKEQAAAMSLPDRTTKAGGDNVDAVRMSVTGYDEEPFLLNDNLWQQVRFGNWCERYGLVAGKSYVINLKRVTKYIPCAYNEIVVPDSYLPTELIMGYNRTGVGYVLDDSSNDGGKKYAYTLVAIVGYDTDGKVVNTHYPCPLDSLNWKYISLKD